VLLKVQRALGILLVQLVKIQGPGRDASTADR